MTTVPTPSLPDIPDILHHVFSYLDPHDQSYDGAYECRRSLAVSARTCRGFTDPALKVLWRWLPDDQPLSDLLCVLGIAAREQEPEDVTRDGKDKPRRYELSNQVGLGYEPPHLVEEYSRRWKKSRGYNIRHFLQSVGDPRKHAGWPRFAEYATRVRAITLFAFDGPAWCRIWKELGCALDGAPVLPMLSSVAFCSIGMQVPCLGALALISPSVRNLDFTLGRGEYPWPRTDDKNRRIFAQCFLSAPEIEKLRLALPPSRLGLSLLQTHCSRINHLEVTSPLKADEVLIMTELPALQYLSISLAEASDFTLPKLTFKSLTTLVMGGVWLNLNVFFENVRLPQMHTLSLVGWHYGEAASQLAAGATQCFHAISKHASITSLSVSTSHGYVAPPAGCVIRGLAKVKGTFRGQLVDMVHPLLSLSALRHVRLRIPAYFDPTCTSSDLRIVAESWPTLETFHLNVVSTAPPGSTPRGTKARNLRALLGFEDPDITNCWPRERSCGDLFETAAHFAHNCPRLRLLHLPAMEITERAFTAVEYPQEPHGLQTLVVPKVLLSPGRIDLLEKVSEVVGRVFPLVGSVFRPERFAVEDNGWAVARGAGWCPECTRSPKVVF